MDIILLLGFSFIALLAIMGIILTVFWGLPFFLTMLLTPNILPATTTASLVVTAAAALL